jgi:hypothetical protein
MGNKMFVPICMGLDRKLGVLVVNESHVANWEGLPIDLFISNSDLLDNNDFRSFFGGE